ncbi:MAG: radical SAM protein [Elusimicrobia bacterium]|nr:radical SAM protein [Elusimicrobiota bacterium]
MPKPAYLRLAKRGELKARAAALRELMRECALCPRRCRAKRLEGGKGACLSASEPIVSSFGPHFGEERPLVGSGGSGTIFLTRCNLRCIFCQNYDISQLGEDGGFVKIRDLAGMMLGLQERGCHNVNFVTPTHQIAAIVEAAALAAEQGLRVPLVYNSGGYDGVEALRLLEGVFDIYMPDAKYGDNEAGKLLSGVPDYWDRCQEALAEMHRQVGDLSCDGRGIARRGLLVRHLVLPQGLAGSKAVMGFLARLSRETYVNVMAQYRPCWRAEEVRAVDRPLTPEEYDQAVEEALSAGLRRLDSRVKPGRLL